MFRSLLYRSRSAHIYVGFSERQLSKSLLTLAVNQVGLGRDIWTLPFDNITKTLEVRSSHWMTYETVADYAVPSLDLLLYRASLSDLCWADQNIDSALLPAYLSTTKPTTRHLGHDNDLCTLYHHIRHSNCAAVYSGTHCLGALGWRASWAMPESQCCGLVICRHQHRS
jgi:hypothetical protein